MTIRRGGGSTVGATSAPAQVFIGAYTASASSSFSIDGCFTSDYDVHVIEWYGTAAAGSPVVSARMRVAGVDNSSSNYDVSLIIDNPPAPASSLVTAGTSVPLFKVATTLSTARIMVVKAATATATALRSNYQTGITSPVQGMYAAGHNVATAYDGITFIPASSTLTGTFVVFGMRSA